jgi:hypothetical protein
MPSDIVHELGNGLVVVARDKLVTYSSVAEIVFACGTSIEVIGANTVEGNFQGDGALAISAVNVSASDAFRDRPGSYKLGTLKVSWGEKGDPDCSTSRVRFGDGSQVSTSDLEGAVVVDYTAGGILVLRRVKSGPPVQAIGTGRDALTLRFPAITFGTPMRQPAGAGV